jgi:hypothetical protein
MLTVERRFPIEGVPICRVVGLRKEVGEEIQRWISGLRLGVNIEVAVGVRGLLIRAWASQIEATAYVHPEDYVNDSGPWARRNPSFAAVATGLIEILKELGLYDLAKSNLEMITWNE